MSGSSSFKGKNQNGSYLGAECMVSVSCEIGFEVEISVESRQDQLRHEPEAHVEQGSSLLVGGIAASPTIT